MMRAMAGLSYILVTDTVATIEPVLTSLERSSTPELLEVVVALPERQREAAEQRLAAFAFRVVVPIANVESLARARAAAVRAASAPLVFIGETHTYPDPDLVAALVAALDGPFAAVAPALENANPGTALSWASFLPDYGRYFSPRAAGEIPSLASHNCAFRRDVLLGLAPDLEQMLNPTAELATLMRAGGHRLGVEPRARIAHLNVDRPVAWLHERFLHGRLVGGNRADGWSAGRRLAYALASPAIPPIVLRRIRRQLAAGAPAAPFPRGTWPALVLGVLVAAAGELCGYVVGTRRATARMAPYELHKTRYASTAGER